MVGGERTTCASTALKLRRANTQRPLTHWPHFAILAALHGTNVASSAWLGLAWALITSFAVLCPSLQGHVFPGSDLKPLAWSMHSLLVAASMMWCKFIAGDACMPLDLDQLHLSLQSHYCCFYQFKQMFVSVIPDLSWVVHNSSNCMY